MRKVIPLKGKGKVDYYRKHDLTTEEIKASPVFGGHDEQEIEEVKTTFIKMCQILMECIEKQHNEVDFRQDNAHIATEQLIELESFNRKAA